VDNNNKLMSNNKSGVILFLVSTIMLILVFNVISAETNNYAPVKQNDCIVIKQTCASCTYLNVSISYPNSSIAINNQAMTTNGGGLWTYTFCSTQNIGRHDVNTCGNLNGVAQCNDAGTLYFEVTPTGQSSNPNFYYLIFIVSLGVIVFGLWIKDAPITILGTFGLYFLGIYVLLFGLNGVKDGVYTWAIGIILLALAAYVSTKSAYEMIQDEGGY
jgi:hypothetical protein